MVKSIAIDADGLIMAGGAFSTYAVHITPPPAKHNIAGIGGL